MIFVRVCSFSSTLYFTVNFHVLRCVVIQEIHDIIIFALQSCHVLKKIPLP